MVQVSMFDNTCNKFRFGDIAKWQVAKLKKIKNAKPVHAIKITDKIMQADTYNELVGKTFGYDSLKLGIGDYIIYVPEHNSYHICPEFIFKILY
jgi:hypothetical protein